MSETSAGFLTPEQRLAVTVIDRPFALIAGAGSGKTTVLVERYLTLLRRGISPRSILTVTFTRDAAEQLKDRILAALGRMEPPPAPLITAVEHTPLIGTLHSFCYSLLDQYGSVLGLRPISRILTSFEIADNFELEFQDWLESLGEEELSSLLDTFSRAEIKAAVRELYDSRFVYLPPVEPPLDSLAQVAQPFIEALQAKLRAQGAYSFDELEHLALKILREKPEITERLQREITHVCVDEFQDTSRVQWEIVKCILGERFEKLFVVGDPKQSIYGFRNADVSLFLDVAGIVEEKGGMVAALSSNFRSHPTLLAEVNSISERVFRTSTVPFEPMNSGREGKEEVKPRLHVRRYGIEANEVTRAVREQLTAGASPKDIALLFRVSDRVSQYFNALASQGVPVHCHQSGKLFQCYDVVDLIHYLEAVLDPLDDYHLSAFLRSPYLDFSYADLWAIKAREGTSLFEKAAGDKRLAWFVGLIEKGEPDVQSALSHLFRNTAYFPGQREAVLELLGPLSRPGLSVAEAVLALRRWQQEDVLFQASLSSGGAEGVTLMTVHGAKGLEYPHVFLVDNLRVSPRRSPVIRVAPGEPPAARFKKHGEVAMTPTYETLSARQFAREQEESRRILYVALTRAKESLTVFLPRDGKIPKGSWGELLEEILKEMRGQVQEVPF